MASSVKPSDGTNPTFGALDARTAAALLAVAGEIALVMDGAGVIRDVALTGGGDSQFDTATQWVGRPWNETVSGDSRAKIDLLLREAVHQGVSKRRQVNHVMGDVMDVPVSYTTVKLGQDGSLVAVGRDMRHVSALQQRLVEAQQAMERDYWRLRHVETRYRLLFQLASDGILVLDASTLKVLDANGAAGQIFGEPTDRLIGRTFPLGMDAPAARALEELLSAARSAGREPFLPRVGVVLPSGVGDAAVGALLPCRTARGRQHRCQLAVTPAGPVGALPRCVRRNRAGRHHSHGQPRLPRHH